MYSVFKTRNKSSIEPKKHQGCMHTYMPNKRNNKRYLLNHNLNNENEVFCTPFNMKMMIPIQSFE